MERAERDRYLRILGLKERPPSLAALGEILRAHLSIIPFENLSKLYHLYVRRRRDLVDPLTYLEDVERFHFGGTCYALNHGLYLLLSRLGYEVRLCGADMSEPDAHMVVVVTLDGQDFLADAGYAGPFFEPVPLRLVDPRVITMGRDRYEFSTDGASGRLRLDHFRDGEYRHSFSVNPRARQIGEFRDVIAASFEDRATFRNALLIVRYAEDGAEVLHNMRFIETRRGVSSTRVLRDRGEVAETAAERFGMPRQTVEELLADLPMGSDPDG